MELRKTSGQINWASQYHFWGGNLPIVGQLPAGFRRCRSAIPRLVFKTMKRRGAPPHRLCALRAPRADRSTVQTSASQTQSHELDPGVRIDVPGFNATNARALGLRWKRKQCHLPCDPLPWLIKANRSWICSLAVRPTYCQIFHASAIDAQARYSWPADLLKHSARTTCAFPQRCVISRKIWAQTLDARSSMFAKLLDYQLR